MFDLHARLTVILDELRGEQAPIDADLIDLAVIALRLRCLQRQRPASGDEVPQDRADAKRAARARPCGCSVLWTCMPLRIAEATDGSEMPHVLANAGGKPCAETL